MKRMVPTFVKEPVRSMRRGKQMRKLEGFDYRSGLGDSAWLLYGMARSAKPTVCVEIGSARGKSACFVGMALKENGRGKLYAIDPHMPTAWNDTESVETYPIIRRHISELGLADYVEVVRRTSHEAAADWSLPIDMIFIDGDHSYEGVRRDFELFLPHVKETGIIVFHDTMWDLTTGAASRDDMGVPRFVEELRVRGYPMLTVMQNFGVSILQPKVGGVSLAKP
jgi:predicted O-methyltransferase YrrM